MNVIMTRARTNSETSTLDVSPAIVSALGRSRLLPALPLIVLLPVAGYLWGEPGNHALAVFICYLCLVFAGGIEIHARGFGKREPAPQAYPAATARGHDEWAASLRRLESIVAGFSEPAPGLDRTAQRVTLH